MQFKDDFADGGGEPDEAITVRIADLILDPRLQTRARLNERVVERYAKQLRQGVQFPPIGVAIIDGRPCVFDGFHRVEAHGLAGRSTIQAVCREATEAEAETWAGCSNHTHGLPLSAVDARRAREKAVSGYIKSRQHLMGRRGAKSLADIARELTDQGCPISKAAVRRILKENHPATYDRFFQVESRPEEWDGGPPDDGGEALARAVAMLAAYEARVGGLKGDDRRKALLATRETLERLRGPGRRRTKQELEIRVEEEDADAQF